MNTNTNTNTVASESNKAKRAAWKYFENHGFKNHKGMVLHHVDVELKESDPERYNKWLISDVVPMNIAQHRAYHMSLLNAKGTYNNSEEHNKRISESLKESTIRSSKIKVLKVNVVETVEDDGMVFETLADAARYIGCSRQLVSQCLRPNTNNRRAMGYQITLVD